MMAPLCGSESKETEAMAIARWRNSGSPPCCVANVWSCSAKVWRVIDRPPEDDPVIPEMTAVAIVPIMTGLLDTSNNESRNTTKTASEAITAPKPTSEAVVNAGSTALRAPSLRESM